MNVTDTRTDEQTDTARLHSIAHSIVRQIVRVSIPTRRLSPTRLEWAWQRNGTAVTLDREPFWTNALILTDIACIYLWANSSVATALPGALVTIPQLFTQTWPNLYTRVGLSVGVFMPPQAMHRVCPVVPMPHANINSSIQYTYATAEASYDRVRS